MARFGDYELNLAARKLFRAGKEVDLTTKEFGLLAYFVARRGCALTRNDILGAVWGDAVIVTPRSIDRCVATLRAKIEPDQRQSGVYPHDSRYRVPVRAGRGIAASTHCGKPQFLGDWFRFSAANAIFLDEPRRGERR